MVYPAVSFKDHGVFARYGGESVPRSTVLALKQHKKFSRLDPLVM